MKNTANNYIKLMLFTATVVITSSSHAKKTPQRPSSTKVNTKSLNIQEFNQNRADKLEMLKYINQHLKPLHSCQERFCVHDVRCPKAGESINPKMYQCAADENFLLVKYPKGPDSPDQNSDTRALKKILGEYGNRFDFAACVMIDACNTLENSDSQPLISMDKICDGLTTISNSEAQSENEIKNKTKFKDVLLAACNKFKRP